MELLDHPHEYRDGVRFLYLCGRKKDGAEPRRISRVTHSYSAHVEAVAELAKLSVPGERIYGSLDPRNILTAAKHFQHAMIDDDPEVFFRHLRSRWDSAIMQPTARDAKLWLWDCDSPGDEYHVRNSLPPGAGVEQYAYPTKNGAHIITKPFDLRAVPPEVARLRQDNAMLLWGYSHANVIAGASDTESEKGRGET